MLVPALAGCSPAQPDTNSPAAGAITITGAACGSCHRIPGIEGADGDVGPSLAHFARQQMIVGRLPNSPVNLARYLKSPGTVVPGNAMPDQRLTDAQIQGVVAYLSTLR
jgi:cytochrome c2